VSCVFASDHAHRRWLIQEHHQAWSVKSCHVTSGAGTVQQCIRRLPLQRLWR